MTELKMGLVILLVNLYYLEVRNIQIGKLFVHILKELKKYQLKSLKAFIMMISKNNCK